MKKRRGQTEMFDEEPLTDPPDPRPRPNWTLKRVREWLRVHVNVGTDCPCCGQHAKVYKRPLNGSMAYTLILMSRAPLEVMDEKGYFHVPSFLNSRFCGLDARTTAAIRGDWAKLVHWDLIEHAPREREDGSARTGEWRVTALGVAFASGQVRVLSHLRIYNKKPLGLTGDHIWIKESLGKRFNYDEIMADATVEPREFQ